MLCKYIHIYIYFFCEQKASHFLENAIYKLIILHLSAVSKDCLAFFLYFSAGKRQLLISTTKPMLFSIFNQCYFNIFCLKIGQNKAIRLIPNKIKP